MNIFHLHKDFDKAALMHNDKHVVKMCVEYAQLMSTSHRVLDGEMYYSKTKSGAKIRRWRLDGNREPLLYKASHIDHPSNLWTRKTFSNYMYIYGLWDSLCKEYTHRYDKIHMSYTKLKDVLIYPPDNISSGPLTEFAQAMPDECKDSDPVIAYRNYYREHKAEFSKWSKRNVPEWFAER